MADRASAASNGSEIDPITVGCQKPSALPFSDVSGVGTARAQEAIRLVGTLET